MPELSIDMASANRFISSLSKSLQALCHGCMDFDSGIEIMGYININIDSGNKVDYVLNEKVCKGNSNSMTFVSNSFLAKKDQQKQRQDGACSPIPELQEQMGSHQQHGSYSYHHRSAFQHHTSSFPQSSYSRHSRGAKKRSWAGTDRDRNASYQKHSRGGASQYAHHPSYRPSSSQNIGASSSVDPSSQSQLPGSSNDSVDNVHIKQELNNDDENNVGEQSVTEQAHCTESESVDDSNIKSEPSAVPESESGASLDPSTDAPLPHVPGSSDDLEQAHSSGQGDAFEEKLPLKFQGENAPNPTDSTDQEDNSGFMAEASEEYDESQEMYPGSSYTDQGEGSGDAQQFDVIEIGDDEEDQAMYSDAQFLLSTDPQRVDYLPTLVRELSSSVPGTSLGPLSITDYGSPETFETQRGALGLRLGGFSYNKHFTGKKHIAWRCVHRFCRARIKTTHSLIPVGNFQPRHCHSFSIPLPD